MMGLYESKFDIGIQKMIDSALQKLQNSTEEMGLGEMDELDEINSIDEIKVTNFVKDKTPVLYVDLYVNSNRKDFDNIIASMESLLGSLWFAGAALLVGYIAGHLFPISSLVKKVSK